MTESTKMTLPPGVPKHANTLSFKEMATAFGLTPRTLRYYEFLELLKPRQHGGDRLYDRKQQTRAKLILRGKRFGMRLEDIRQFFELYDTGGATVQLEAWLIQSDGLERVLAAEIVEKQQALHELREVIADTRRRLGSA